MEEVEESVNKNLLKQISPISYRFPKEEFSMNLFIEKFKDIIVDYSEIE
ncbi:MAG: hypothetical protein GX159_06285 [Flavobacteriaceae bacterium]|nr:hypothetical protein [Flavobacteriaceae bacterium]